MSGVVNSTPVPLIEAGVAAAGFAIAHLLSAPPDERVLELFAGDSDRASWPIHNGPTDEALDVIAQGFEPDAVRDEWALLIGDRADAVEFRTHLGERRIDHLGAELSHLASLTAQLARAIGDGDDGAVVAIGGDIAALRRDHVGTYTAEVLAELGARAHTAVLRALSGLTVGFLSALDDVVAAATDAAVPANDHGMP